MSIKFEIVSFELGNVLPYGWPPFLGKWSGTIMGHEFTMVGVIKLKSEWKMKKGKHINDLSALQWREKEFWFEGTSGGGWIYKGETNKGDLYQSNPTSVTWGGFGQEKTDVRNYTWISIPGCNIHSTLQNKLLTPLQRGYLTTANSDIQSVKISRDYTRLQRQANVRGKRNESEIKMWWLIADKLADKKRMLPCIALDRPGMALSGGSGQSGGGFTSLTTSPTRRRVLQFDLGIVGYGQRFTATQVLETIDGKPSISKYIIPGQDDNWCKNIPDSYLEYWRSRLNPSNVEDQTYILEPQGTIENWSQWVENLKKKNLI